jgi:hypothetical protein
MSFVSVGAVDAAEALADLIEISSHVETAVVFDSAGAVAASTVADEGRATALARVGLDLFAAAAGVRPGGPAVTRVEAKLPDGTFVAVRDGERLIAATTTPEPPSGLVLYDLRTALRVSAPQPPPKKKPTRRRTKKADDADVAP